MSTGESLRWERVEGVLPVGEDLTVRQAFEARRDELFIAVDSSGARHLLVRVEEDSSAIADCDSRGITAKTMDMSFRGGDAARYIDIACLDPNGHAALDVIATEIADALDAGSSIHKSDLVATILAKWRRFWAAPHIRLLSREEQVGLFGELWFLVSWLIPVAGATSAFSWRGPASSRHDFEALSASVEVKSTLNSTPRHRISGIHQLAPPQSGPLFLFSLVAREERGAQNCVPALVATCRAQLSSSSDALSYFEDTLAKSGYLDMLASEYAKLRLRIVEEGLYRVTGRFPRLTTDMLHEGIPDGVVKIGYDIELSGFSDCLESRLPFTIAPQLAVFATSVSQL